MNIEERIKALDCRATIAYDEECSLFEVSIQSYVPQGWGYGDAPTLDAAWAAAEEDLKEDRY